MSIKVYKGNDDSLYIDNLQQCVYRYLVKVLTIDHQWYLKAITFISLSAIEITYGYCIIGMPYQDSIIVDIKQLLITG